MSRVRVDDTSPGISYSGSWQTSSDSRQYSSSSHFTTSSGATATIRFTGNLVRVVCTNPAVPDGVIRAEFVLNGKTDPFVRDSHLNAFYDDQFFFANGLSRTGEHTLVIRNLGTQVPLHIDYIEIEGGNAIVPEQIAGPPAVPAPQNTTSPNSPQRPTPTPTATATRTVVETSVEVVTSAREPSSSSRSQTESLSEGRSDSSSSSAPASRNVRSSGASTVTDASSHSGSVTVTAFQIVTTSVSGVAVVTTLGPGEGHAKPTSQGQSLSTGAIIGIIVGSLFLIGLIGVLVILLIRKRRRGQDRSSIVRQRMARHGTDPPSQNLPRPSVREVEPEDDVEAHSANASSVEPPPRLSLNFMRTLHEKSRPIDNQPLSPIGPDTGSTIAPLTTNASMPMAYAASFRSSYPLSLGPDGAPPAYSSVRLSNAPSSTQAP